MDIFKVEDFVLIKWSYRSPPPSKWCWLLSLELLSYFEYVIHLFQTHVILACVLGATPNHIPLKYSSLGNNHISISFPNYAFKATEFTTFLCMTT